MYNFSANVTDLAPLYNIFSSVSQHYIIGLKIWVSVMLTFGLSGGILSYALALTILSKRSLRSGSGILIAHTLLTEGTLLFVSYPILTVQTYLAQSYLPGPTTCQIVGWIYYVILQATHWTEMLIALNRFVAVILPHQYKTITRKNIIIFMISSCWILCITCMTMPVIQAGATIDSNNFWRSCTLRGLKGHAEDFFILLCFNAYVPIGVEGILYLSMFLIIFLRRVSGTSTNQISTATPQVLAGKVAEVELLNRRLRVSKMLFAGFIVPAVCSLLTPVIAAAWPPYVTYPLLHLTLRAVLVMGYAMHPVIFLSMSSDYRKYLRRIFVRTRDENDGQREGKSQLRTFGNTMASGGRKSATHDGLRSDNRLDQSFESPV